MEIPNSQSRRSCASILRLMIFTHNAVSMRGAAAGRLYRGLDDIVDMSGIPMQSLKQKANATPKYHGSNWSIKTFPIVNVNCCIRSEATQLRSTRLDSEYSMAEHFIADETARKFCASERERNRHDRIRICRLRSAVVNRRTLGSAVVVRAPPCLD